MASPTPITHTINAAGKRIGRVATEAAVFLMGKNTPDFAKNLSGTVSVKIENASKLVIADKKRSQKNYRHYTGYPGGLRQENLDHLANRLGYAELLRKAVKGMLPKNRLQQPRLNRLSISE